MAIQYYRQSTVPTIFVHGWGSSARVEDKMAGRPACRRDQDNCARQRRPPGKGVV